MTSSSSTSIQNAPRILVPRPFQKKRNEATSPGKAEKSDPSAITSHLQGKWKALFYIITIIVLTALFVKLPLFLTRQLVPRLSLPLLCPKNSGAQSGIGQEYIFTMVIYSTLFIGRFVASLILQIHIYKFFFIKCTVSEVHEFKELCIKGLRKKKWIMITFVVLSVYMLAHSLSIPALGITLELKSGKESDCKPYIYEYHTVYWILDIIRYLYDVAIRLFMVLATLAIGVIWTREITQSEGTDHHVHPKAPTNYKEYLEDRQIASNDHSTRWQDYVKRGERIECILEIFQTWFILPWILFFIGSSLDTDHILRSWKQGPSGDGQYDFSEVTYMVYSFNQLFLLTIPYICSKKMNTHHHNYIFNSRKQQLEIQKTASRKAFAYLNKIEKEDHFNFVPRIWGSSIKIQVENPLYIAFLLVGIFFTVVEALI